MALSGKECMSVEDICDYLEEEGFAESLLEAFRGMKAKLN